MSAALELAPALKVAQWLNTPEPIKLEDLRGRVVVLHAFQMLCPGCVAQGIPQTKRIQAAFPADELAVIGLHTVFEHHAVMNAGALQVFAHEYGLSFPIGIDQPPVHGHVPLTMQAYGLRGTPSLIVLDREGRIRLNHFGHADDLPLGALLGRLLGEPFTPAQPPLP
jgi:peroxiredoxin